MARNKSTRDHIIRALQHKLEELESSFRSSSNITGNPTATGIEPLNQILHGGGFRQGTLVEWLAGGEGAGAATLAFQAVTPWLSAGQTCVIVDASEEFYPPALTALGIDFEQMLIVHPTSQEVFWTLEQALRCRGVAVTVGWLGPAPERVLRRLQLAVETGGGIGVFFRPLEVRCQPTWANLRLLVTALPAPAESPARRARFEVLYCQGGKNNGIVEVNIDDETGDVRVAAPLASARDARQAT